MFYKSEKLIYSFIDNYNSCRRNDFRGTGKYFDFIFLCGKKINDDKPDNRRIIQNKIITDKFSLFAEDLYKVFDSLQTDMLTVEEFLLSISTATVLIVESYGSACELGAFSFVDSNIEKLWVINDIKYIKDESFINNGPLFRINKRIKDHILYQQFDSNGLIQFDSLAFSTLKTIGRKTFGGEPVSIKEKALTINDLGFILCLFVDYIMTFGFLVEDHIIYLLKNLYKVDHIFINLPSKKIEKDANNVYNILVNCLRVLELSKLLVHKTNKGKDYYCLQFSTLRNIGKWLTDFHSILFHSAFLTRARDREIAKIKNTAIKEGFRLW